MAGMPARIEKIICTVLHEPYRRQEEETMEVLLEAPEGFYGAFADPE